MRLLERRYALVTGVANHRSIAWAVARQFHLHGATLCLTYQDDRHRRHVEELADVLTPRPLVLPCDVRQRDDLQRLAQALDAKFGRLDILVHSIAYADREDLDGPFVNTSPSGFNLALTVSTYSLIALTRTLLPLLQDGGSIVTMTHLGSERVIPHYNIMGVAKAALEAAVRYLAADLGPRRIRVNAISAGPIRTLAAAGVPGIRRLMADMLDKAPLGPDLDAADVADAAVFLAGPWSRAVTGTVLFVDNGYHLVGV